MIISRIVDAIPDKLPKSPSVDELNLHEVKSVYTSCMDIVSRMRNVILH
jgi:hypothetical protein